VKRKGILAKGGTLSKENREEGNPKAPGLGKSTAKGSLNRKMETWRKRNKKGKMGHCI